MSHEPKKPVTVTIDPAVLERIDAVAEARGESRSSVFERMLLNGIDGEESLLSDMENPVTRAVLKAMGSSPRLVHMIAKMVGNELSKDEAEAMHKSIQEQAELGRKRVRRRRKSKVGRAGNGA